MRRRKDHSGQTALDHSGQTTVEYILILAVIVSLFVIVAKGLRETGLGNMASSKLFRQFKASYQLGHPEAKGYDDGPEKHIRVPEGDNFRLFINPG